MFFGVRLFTRPVPPYFVYFTGEEVDFKGSYAEPEQQE